jgi:precorrin-2 methylase
MSGILYGVGVGPGDPELMTLKAARLIGAARVVAYPALEGAKLPVDNSANSVCRLWVIIWFMRDAPFPTTPQPL